MREMSNTQGESYNSSMRLMFLSAKEKGAERGAGECCRSLGHGGLTVGCGGRKALELF